MNYENCTNCTAPHLLQPRLYKEHPANTNREGTRAAGQKLNEQAESQAYTESQRQYELQQIGAKIQTLRPAFVALVGQLQNLIYEAMIIQGFWEDEQRNFAAKTALIHSELSEMLEANRKGIESDDKVPQYAGEEAEAADTLIRLFDLAGGFNLRLGNAVIDKMMVNLSRAYMHGKAY
jgi:NTP pyrophosphatase (non-canonical NTP hydrolase)